MKLVPSHIKVQVLLATNEENQFSTYSFKLRILYLSIAKIIGYLESTFEKFVIFVNLVSHVYSNANAEIIHHINKLTNRR